MCKSLAFVLLLAGVVASVGAARLPMEVFASSETTSGGLKGMLDLMRGVSYHKGELHRNAFIRFRVPPSEASGFEDAWMDLEKYVAKEERDTMTFHLTKFRMDNLNYISCGEWATHDAMHDHFTSDHFMDFAEYVDNHGVRWEMETLRSLSPEMDEEQRRKHEGSVEKRRMNMHHVLTRFIVPPGEGMGLTDTLLDHAEKTIDEKGNRMFLLRKSVVDNTHYYAYGAWDSMSDFLDHIDSKHHGRMLDYAMDNDIVWYREPLIMIGGTKE